MNYDLRSRIDGEKLPNPVFSHPFAQRIGNHNGTVGLLVVLQDGN
jgi:hypothetical protein